MIFLLLFWPVLCALACIYSKKRAAIASPIVVAGLLILPNAHINLPGIPEISKDQALALSLLIAILLHLFLYWTPKAPGRITLPFADMCAIAFLVCPVLTSLQNGLGSWDGLSHAVSNAAIWTVPYFAGRVIFSTATHLQYFLNVWMTGAIVILPLVLFEANFGPNLHQFFYGFEARPFRSYSAIWGPLGWVPILFFKIPFELSMFVSMGSLIAVGKYNAHASWEWRWRSVALVFGTLLAKKWTGVILCSAGTLIIYAMTKFPRLRGTALLLAVLAVVLYPVTRSLGLWSGGSIAAIAEVASERRAESLTTRLVNEDILVEKAMLQPFLGWGRWGRSRVYNDRGEDICLTDGLWVILLGQSGIVGLVAYFGLTVGPVARYALSCSAGRIRNQKSYPLIISSAILLMHATDCIVNAFPSCIFSMLSGSLLSVLNDDSPRLVVSENCASTRRGSIKDTQSFFC